jgi:hypothetical protein
MPFNAVQIDLSGGEGFRQAEELEEALVTSLSRWEAEGTSAAWIKVPEYAGGAVEVAARHGFKYHHAEEGAAHLSLWLGDVRSSFAPFLPITALTTVHRHRLQALSPLATPQLL